MAGELEAIWHAHKRFILQVGGGALAFSLVLGWRGAIAAEAARLKTQNASAQAALQDDIARLEGVEGLEKGRAAALGEKLEPAVLLAVLWKPADGFTLPKGEGAPGLFYAGAARTAAEDVAAHAARWNAKVPASADDLGLPRDVQDAQVPEALAQVDVIRRVVLRALDGGVRTITRVSPGEATYTARDGATGFVRAVPVRLSFQATTAALAGVLAELQVEGSFAEVTALEVKRLDARGAAAPLEVELGVQALSVVDKAPDAARTAAATGGTPPGRRGPRRFGRDR